MIVMIIMILLIIVVISIVVIIILQVISMKFKMTSNIRDSVLDFYICTSALIHFLIYLHSKVIICTSLFAELFFNLIM